MRGHSLLGGAAAKPATYVAATSFCLLLMLVGDVGATLAKAASNSVTFPDSTGEDAQAPDVASVVVSNDDRGRLTFRVGIPNRPTLTADMLLLLVIDADANPASGSADFGGADYLIELDGPLTGRAGVGLFRWSGTDFTTTGVSQSSLVFSYANGATINVNASELGATRRFGLSVIAVSGIALTAAGEPDFTNARFDNAPDRGSYSYDVRITPPTLLVRSAGSRPLRPAAGKLYTVLTAVSRSDGAAVASGTVTCRATIGTRAVAVAARSVAGGRASCTFRIPAKTRGKTVRGTVVVSSQGLRATRTFSARIA